MRPSRWTLVLVCLCGWTIGPLATDLARPAPGPRGAGTVAICHRPPADPCDAQVLHVHPGGVLRHLLHGDSLGECPGECVPSSSPVPRTGQTNCWGELGAPIDCAGSGQDGELLAGIELEPRFTDHLDGTVTDHLTGLRWLKDAGCFGALSWTEALAAAAALSSGSCGLSDGSVAGDWRIPNVKQLGSLNDYGQTYPALPVGHPFTAVAADAHWTSTTFMYSPETAWLVDMITGGAIGAGFKPDRFRAWPVRREP